MILINNLNKTYGSLSVLQNVSLEIHDNQIYGIIGRSGVGKSTLLRCINGIEPFDSGQIIVDGRSIKELGRSELRQYCRDVGMVFQQFSLVNRLSVRKNIALPMECWKISKTDIKKRVDELLVITGLTEKANENARDLSGGQKQRVAIARALSMGPKILLCDEATSALDPKMTDEILSLLNRIRSELSLTILIVTHQMDVVKRTCDQVCLLEDGSVAATGKVEELFMNRPPALRHLLGQGDEQRTLPPGKTIEIVFPRNSQDTPFLTRMSRDLAVDFIILENKVDRLKFEVIPSATIHLSLWAAERVTRYLEEKAIPYYTK